MYVIIWKFAVKPGRESEFESAYGPDGVWAQLFRRGHGFIATELLRDATAAGQYITIDRWESPAAFQNFQARFAEGYKAIDQECEALTESESKIGSFELISSEVDDTKSQDHDEF